VQTADQKIAVDN